VFRQASVWVIAGLVAGTVITIALSFILLHVAYGVNPLNPALLLADVVAVSLAACTGCYLPARRAAHMDPMEALRCE